MLRIKQKITYVVQDPLNGKRKGLSHRTPCCLLISTFVNLLIQNFDNLNAIPVQSHRFLVYAVVYTQIDIGSPHGLNGPRNWKPLERIILYRIAQYIYLSPRQWEVMRKMVLFYLVVFLANQCVVGAEVGNISLKINTTAQDCHTANLAQQVIIPVRARLPAGINTAKGTNVMAWAARSIMTAKRRNFATATRFATRSCARVTIIARTTVKERFRGTITLGVFQASAPNYQWGNSLQALRSLSFLSRFAT